MMCVKCLVNVVCLRHLCTRCIAGTFDESEGEAADTLTDSVCVCAIMSICTKAQVNSPKQEISNAPDMVRYHANVFAYSNPSCMQNAALHYS